MVIHHWFVGSINRPACTVFQYRFPLKLYPRVVRMFRCLFRCTTNILLPKTETCALNFPGITHGLACASKFHRQLQENISMPKLALDLNHFTIQAYSEYSWNKVVGRIQSSGKSQRVRLDVSPQDIHRLYE